MQQKILTLIGLSLLLFLINFPALGSEDGTVSAGELNFSGKGFANGIGQDIVVNEVGVTLAGGAASGSYLSPVLQAPLAYNAVVPQWLMDMPPATHVEISLRTGTAVGQWSEWWDIHESHDWTRPEDHDVVGEMILVGAGDVTHTHIQFAVNFSRYDDTAVPVLHELRLTFIDSTRGPTAEELVARQQALDLDGPQQSQTIDSPYPKPPVVSRQVWCTDPACHYTGMQYHPVTHLILHHTASSNSSDDWAATIRAIWYFHAVTRGWGDIGYNYLVDMNGVLYEGRLGGDDVIGTHAAGANAGSMALSLLGNFVSSNPPQPMLNAAVELFAWKAAQKNINVYDASRLPELSWGLPHFMGHRDVYGSTACPGDQAHVLLPWFRDQVAQRIGFVSPHFYVDELSSAFTKSNTSWYTAQSGCGFNGHAYYTWSMTEPAHSTNWGEWRPPIPANGRYELSVYAPYCVTGRAETHGATYTIHHANGVNTVVTSHENNVGTWMVLGQYDFLAGNSGKVRLTDLTTTDSGLGVWFDAIRLRPIGAPLVVANQQPTPNAWVNQQTVTFTWTIGNGASATGITLQVATDATFTDVVEDASLPASATSHDLVFSQDYANLYWRVIVATSLDGPVSSTPTQFGIDATPPTSQVYAIYQLNPGLFVAAWQGNDSGSGVTAYNVEYRPQGSINWIPWLNQTSATAALFTPPLGDGYNPVYWFRSQAVDAAGNVELLPGGEGDMHTGQANFLSHVIMLPIIKR